MTAELQKYHISLMHYFFSNYKPHYSFPMPFLSSKMQGHHYKYDYDTALIQKRIRKVFSSNPADIPIPRNNKKPIIVLDIDETLVHARTHVEQVDIRSFIEIVTLLANNDNIILVIWSAADSYHVAKMLEYIDPINLIQYVIFRCEADDAINWHPTAHPIYDEIKYLSLIPNQMGRAILFDNAAHAISGGSSYWREDVCIQNTSSAVQVRDFISGFDTELLRMFFIITDIMYRFEHDINPTTAKVLHTLRQRHESSQLPLYQEGIRGGYIFNYSLTDDFIKNLVTNINDSIVKLNDSMQTSGPVLISPLATVVTSGSSHLQEGSVCTPIEGPDFTSPEFITQDSSMPIDGCESATPTFSFS